MFFPFWFLKNLTFSLGFSSQQEFHIHTRGNMSHGHVRVFLPLQSLQTSQNGVRVSLPLQSQRGSQTAPWASKPSDLPRVSARIRIESQSGGVWAPWDIIQIPSIPLQFRLFRMSTRRQPSQDQMYSLVVQLSIGFTAQSTNLIASKISIQSLTFYISNHFDWNKR